MWHLYILFGRVSAQIFWPYLKIRLSSHYRVLGNLYIFWKQILFYQRDDLQIFFSQSISHLSFLWTIFFKEQMLFIFMSNLSICPLWMMLLVLYLRNLCLIQNHKNISPMFPFRNFVFRSMVLLELLFVHSKRYESRLIFLHTDIQIVQHLKRLFIFNWFFPCTVDENQLSICTWVYFWTLLYIFSSISQSWLL